MKNTLNKLDQLTSLRSEAVLERSPETIMPSVPTYLRNYRAVIDAFGYWPDFHDSPVLSFRADAESIILEVEAWEVTDEVDAQGHFKLTKRHAVGFEFQEIVSTDLDQFIPENVLFELGLSSEEERQEQGFFTVVLDSAMGSDLCGQFRARSGLVSFVRPCESNPNKANKSCEATGDNVAS
jgi:hypothetical protein